MKNWSDREPNLSPKTALPLVKIIGQKHAQPKSPFKRGIKVKTLGLSIIDKEEPPNRGEGDS